VLLRTADLPSLASRYNGPYVIMGLRSGSTIAKLSPTWVGGVPDRQVETHVSRLKRYYRPPADSAGAILESIVSYQLLKQVPTYKVKVLGRPLEDAVFIPAHEVRSLYPALVARFNQNVGPAGPAPVPVPAPIPVLSASPVLRVQPHSHRSHRCMPSPRSFIADRW
jgi:hypothetical protein